MFPKEEEDRHVPMANPFPWWSCLSLSLAVLCHLREPYNSYIPEALLLASVLGCAVNWVGAVTITYKFLEEMNVVKVRVEDETQ